MAARIKTRANRRSLQDTPLDLPAITEVALSTLAWRADTTRRAASETRVPARRAYDAVKAVLDFAAALILLVLAAPVLLVCMALVKLTSPGPAIYSQVRLGKGGRRFRIYKIRSMTHNCESQSGVRWSTAGDPRVTVLGRFLRKTHLDELPQLWNILRGDMSLVGPRPERPEFVTTLQKEIPEYRRRLTVRPGVTGLAQVQLPPDTDLESVRRKVACDLTYIQHRSWWLDLRLLALTVLHLSGLPCHGLCRRLLPCTPAPQL
jgi:lipopolysaccharide/colanic/teichoic acid biosynthesis glycosyltransferase